MIIVLPRGLASGNLNAYEGVGDGLVDHVVYLWFIRRRVCTCLLGMRSDGAAHSPHEAGLALSRIVVRNYVDKANTGGIMMPRELHWHRPGDLLEGHVHRGCPLTDRCPGVAVAVRIRRFTTLNITSNGIFLSSGSDGTFLLKRTKDIIRVTAHQWRIGCD